MRNRSAILESVFAIVSMTEMAKALGVSLQSVCLWKRVPRKRVAEVSRLTGLPRHALRPDIFGLDPSMVLAAQTRGRELGVDLDPAVAQAIIVAALHHHCAVEVMPSVVDEVAAS